MWWCKMSKAADISKRGLISGHDHKQIIIYSAACSSTHGFPLLWRTFTNRETTTLKAFPFSEGRVIPLWPLIRSFVSTSVLKWLIFSGRGWEHDTLLPLMIFFLLLHEDNIITQFFIPWSWRRRNAGLSSRPMLWISLRSISRHSFTKFVIYVWYYLENIAEWKESYKPHLVLKTVFHSSSSLS